ncbi:hypothetical protein M422DRAFT_256371 [Sphaerobolus stellatus SS14]|uniref:Uncharacterized protein n=1 Tax=Sphaerobolus stellatus (strain SS14) TaxID=990650 RepID=A0A0C9VRQ5_SPHS4|nr:hypothetical protein M422DRAFT_256371 [Sphaerobolus stellatus SS14]
MSPVPELFIRRWQLYVEIFRKQLPHSSNDDWYGSMWSKPPSLDVIATTLEEARLSSWDCSPNDQMASFDDQTCASPSVVTSIKIWAGTMTTNVFTASSMAEKFVWIYSVHMVLSFDNVGKEKWWQNLLENLKLDPKSKHPVKPTGSYLKGNNIKPSKKPLLVLGDSARSGTNGTAAEVPSGTFADASLSSNENVVDEAVVVPRVVKPQGIPKREIDSNLATETMKCPEPDALSMQESPTKKLKSTYIVKPVRGTSKPSSTQAVSKPLSTPSRSSACIQTQKMHITIGTITGDTGVAEAQKDTNVFSSVAEEA